MRKTNIKTMEILHVSYVEKPKAIYNFIRNGFSIDDIVILKDGACHYNLYATKNN